MTSLVISPLAKPGSSQAANLSDPTTSAFLEALRPHGALPLVVAYAGRETRAGYHVTEVKSGRFSGLDCGANPEAWTETFVQVWDVPGADGERVMTAAKFLAIMDKVSRDAGIDPDSRLTFECGDDVGVIGLYAVAGIVVEPRRVLVSLSPRQASCKPRDRWFEAQGLDRPARLTPDDARTEKAIREAASGCCSPSRPAAKGAGCC
ncbi:DUF6428 family protein [Microvirga roseola]|uniref:DUF6428 family protein n=1 Tax=Microvirga roseola TaxID=2883126 RepID=UPI001E573F1F|nr:DUF6428 family protein [Microvirga roseola]